MLFPSLIDARPPYYALDDVAVYQPGFVEARIRPEHPLGHEVGPLAAAEAGRHLAILGACACSSLREQHATHYYLAQRARLVRHGNSTSNAPARFSAVAWSGTRRGRAARAHALLRAAGEQSTLFELDVSYRVLSAAVFQRVFAAHRRDLRAAPRDLRDDGVEQRIAQRNNPYHRPLPLEITRRTPKSVRARLAHVTPQLCSGHFPLYPALPVPLLMQSLSTLCGEALRVRWGNGTRYRVHSADVSAERLAFVGERLVFEAAFWRSDGAREHYQAWAALEDGTSVGWMSIALEPVHSDARVQLNAAVAARR